MLREALLLLRRSKGERATSLQIRLFAFFSLFAVFLVGLGFLALTLIGVFNAAENESRAWLRAEMAHFSDGVADDYGRLSLRGVSFAKALANNIGVWAKRNGINESALAANPERIEELLAEQAAALLSAHENNRCSGVFIILDATVNPQKENAGNSKAGLYLKRTEPNSVASVISNVTCLRGPASVARVNGIELMGQWRMEFDVSGIDFYQKVLNTARENIGVDLSRLYYWSERFLLEGNSEHAMMLCLPLIAQDGTVYGICGMEVSAMLFKRAYSPNNADYPHVFSALAPYAGGSLNTGAGLVAGNSYLTSHTIGVLADTEDRTGLASWNADGDRYVGLTETLRLYPTGSLYEEDIWAFALTMPESDWNAVITRGNTAFYVTVILLLVVSLLTAVFISRRYIRPVVNVLELIKSDTRAELKKTQIVEIDDLLQYLAAKDDERKTLDEEIENLAAKLEQARYPEEPASNAQAAPSYEWFLQNLETLTVTERAVFNLYANGSTAQQIADKLFITGNTVKFHNKNIYRKLGVSSLKALQVYIGMMQEMRDAE